MFKSIERSVVPGPPTIFRMVGYTPAAAAAMCYHLHHRRRYPPPMWKRDSIAATTHMRLVFIDNACNEIFI